MSDDIHHIDNKRMVDCQHNADGKYLFINISKNASTSLRNSIVFNGYSPYKDIINRDQYLKFIIWRNPIDRAVSSFSEIKDVRRDGPFYITESMKWFKEKNIFKSFEMFIDEINGNFYDAHSFPQITFLKDKGIRINDIDETLLVETLEKDYKNLIEKYPNIISSPLLYMQSHNNKKLLNYVYNNIDIKNKIINLYSEDYEIYLKIKEKK